MRDSEIFDKSFITSLTTKLEEKCGDGNSVSTTGLCSELGLDHQLKSTLGAIVSLDIVKGFELTRGRGITMKGQKKRVKKAAAPVVSEPVTADADNVDQFAGLMKSTLNDLFESVDRPIPRKELATAMGCPGYKAEQMISELMKTPEFTSEFKISRGRSGGISRLDNAGSVSVKKSEDDKAEAKAEAVTDATAEPEGVDLAEALAEFVVETRSEEAQAGTEETQESVEVEAKETVETQETVEVPEDQSEVSDEQLEELVEAIMQSEPSELEASLDEDESEVVTQTVAGVLDGVQLEEE